VDDKVEIKQKKGPKKIYTSLEKEKMRKKFLKEKMVEFVGKITPLVIHLLKQHLDYPTFLNFFHTHTISRMTALMRIEPEIHGFCS